MKKTLATLDSETDPFDGHTIPEPFVWGLYTEDKYIYFWGDDCTWQLMEYLSDKDYLIYAHNGGKFDFFFLLEYLDRKKLLIINGRITQAKFGKVTFRDSYSLLPIPLSAYKKDEIDYIKMTWNNREENKTEILEYLYTDCLYLHELVSTFIDRFGLKLTIGGAAIEQLLNSCENKKIERLNLSTDELFRKYYYGGRCEAFDKGFNPNSNHIIYDINSAYPYAMLAEHPDPFRPYYDVTDTIPATGNYFASVYAISYGCLPYRDSKTKAITFPCDVEIRKYNATNWEITAGIDTGTLDIVSVDSVIVFRHTIAFGEFVNKFYPEKKKAKKDGDKITELFVKLLLNNAYGKFAVNSMNYKDFILTNYGEIPPRNGKQYAIESAWREYNADIYSTPAPDEDKLLNVAVAASITGYVRAYLWRHINAATDVIYCDTDSIVCRTFTGNIGAELGDWKNEGTVSEYYIGGKKLYAFVLSDGTVKKASKGSRLKVNEIINLVIKNKTIEWHNNAPTFSLSSGVNFLSRKIKMT